MLERATACLKSGLFQDSVKCARGGRRSNRALHSSFWTHGAADLELPPLWALPLASMSSFLPPRHDSTTNTPSKRSRGERDVVPEKETVGEGIFLDFLYPPKALAWLQGKQGQRLRRWENRNMQRLPEGYVIASKRYSSSKYHPVGHARQEYRGRAGHVPEPRVERAHDRSSAGVVRFKKSVTDAIVLSTKRSTHVGYGISDPGGIDTAADHTPSTYDSEYLAWKRAATLGGADNIHPPTSTDQEAGTPSVNAFADFPAELDETFAKSISDIAIPGLDEKQVSPPTDVYQPFDSASSASDLAQGQTSRLELLRRILTSTPEHGRTYGDGPVQALTSRALTLYESLDAEARSDVRLKIQLLEWLAAQGDELAAMRGSALYHSIPRSSRTISAYQSALTLLLKQKSSGIASELHQEALERLENGYLVSRFIFEKAVERSNWPLALEVATRHNNFYSEHNQLNQVRVFWLHVSEIPKLFRKATSLSAHMRRTDGVRRGDANTRTFCLQFFKEAISQQFLQPDKSLRVFYTDRELREVQPLGGVFQNVLDMDENGAALLEEVLLSMFREESDLNYANYHRLVAYVYRLYCNQPRMIPTEDLLYAFLHRISNFASASRDELPGPDNITIAKLIEDWTRYHGKLNSKATDLLLSMYASHGQVEKFEKMLDYQLSAFPSYADRKESLFNMIYIHARRADLDKAQQAFSEVQRIMADHGDLPDLRCWNVLLHAHMRVDDLEGAITNFNNIVDYAKLQPDSYSFSPLFYMLAKRGDVEGLEQLVEQYDQLVGERRSTDMALSLMTAHFNNDDDAHAAELVLQRTIAMRREGEVLGPLTGCFNALMGFWAVRRNADATMRVYRWMRSEKVRLNGQTFGALIQALLHRRQAPVALQILTEVMPQQQIQATAYHYALLMAGLNGQRMYKNTVDLHNRMIRANIRPTLGTRVNYLKAQAALERQELDKTARESAAESTAEAPVQPVALDETLQELQRLVASSDASDIASGEPTSTSDKLDRQDTLAPYFDFLIYIHGERGCFDVAKKLFEQYKELSHPGQGYEAIPIRMLTALMSVHCYAGEHDKVEEYWKLVRQQADELARRVRVPQFSIQKAVDPEEQDEGEMDPLELVRMDGEVATDSTPASSLSTAHPLLSTRQLLLTDHQTYLPRPVPRRRHILDRPLQWYLKSLTAQSRLPDAIRTVTQLLSQGYTLGKRTWNIFVRSLLSTRPPLALLAFTLTERFLIPHFSGWSKNTRWNPSPAKKFYKSERMREHHVTRQATPPEYETMVALAAAMLELRRAEKVGGKETGHVEKELRRFVGSMREVRSRAAKTVYAVQSMPAVEDELQTRYLGGKGR